MSKQLNDYITLGRSGLRVSPVSIGTMTFGTDWGWGATEEDARRMLDTSYAWLERHLADGRQWAAGADFSLADCGAAPFLFYADWTHRIPDALGRVHAYRARLLAHPAFARAVDEARPFRAYFPLGAPDRD